MMDPPMIWRLEISGRSPDGSQVALSVWHIPSSQSPESVTQEQLDTVRSLSEKYRDEIIDRLLDTALPDYHQPERPSLSHPIPVDYSRRHE